METPLMSLLVSSLSGCLLFGESWPRIQRDGNWLFNWLSILIATTIWLWWAQSMVVDWFGLRCAEMTKADGFQGPIECLTRAKEKGPQVRVR